MLDFTNYSRMFGVLGITLISKVIVRIMMRKFLQHFGTYFEIDLFQNLKFFSRQFNSPSKIFEIANSEGPNVSKFYSKLRNIEPIDSKKYVNYKDIIKLYSNYELNRFAEEYFSTLLDDNFLILKPFHSIEGLGSLLGNFAALLDACLLELSPDNRMCVLDFGCGSGWTSRILTQLGMRTWGVDVSISALKIAQKSLRLQPFYSDLQGNLAFQVTDGISLGFANNKFQRIVCMDSFHHVPNQEAVLKEFFRVLAPGGLAILSEPGPNHSRTDQAQYEMLNFKVIEGDIIIEEIEDIAKGIGFESIEVAVYNPIPTFYSVGTFNALISNDEWTLAQLTKNYCSNHRLIRLKKPA